MPTSPPGFASATWVGSFPNCRWIQDPHDPTRFMWKDYGYHLWMGDHGAIGDDLDWRWGIVRLTRPELTEVGLIESPDDARRWFRDRCIDWDDTMWAGTKHTSQWIYTAHRDGGEDLATEGHAIRSYGPMWAIKTA